MYPRESIDYELPMTNKGFLCYPAETCGPSPAFTNPSMISQPKDWGDRKSRRINHIPYWASAADHKIHMHFSCFVK